ncbi:hypothetical protein CcI49_09145 [Frankia sp. CcI49]|nr:hypothetical protein CcI49_09145 [Frankia sp. CcI49]
MTMRTANEDAPDSPTPPAEATVTHSVTHTGNNDVKDVEGSGSGPVIAVNYGHVGSPASPESSTQGPAATTNTVKHEGDNSVSGLSGSGEGSVTGVNYGTVESPRGGSTP